MRGLPASADRRESGGGYRAGSIGSRRVGDQRLQRRHGDGTGAEKRFDAADTEFSIAVSQPVEYLFRDTAGLRQSGTPKFRQLLAQCRLPNAGRLINPADGALAFQQPRQDHQPLRLGENLQALGDHFSHGAGVIGALAGSSLGKIIDGQKLLLLFALVMILVGILLLRGRGNPGTEGAQCTL
jgi:hypothetical protein